MEYMLFIATDTEPEPADSGGTTIEQWVEEGERRGIRKQGDRLRPPADATTVRVRKGELLVTDGPFTEAKEIIGGVWIVHVKSKEEAVDLAKRVWEIHANVLGPSYVGRGEVRELFAWVNVEPPAHGE